MAEGKGKSKTFTMYDPVTGALMKSGFDAKLEAHTFIADFIAQENGQEKWLDMRESAQVIEEDEIAEYKNGLVLDEEGDSADFEISAKDIEGVTGATGFSVYDDIKAKLIRSGIPEREIEFIHDHDTPQAKDALFKRVNAGDVRFLLGSTPKMGAGTNVQRRLVALHHIDAPWRPSDLEQREGRIIRRGNTLYERDPDGFMVEINRYATAQTYDTRRWQLLEHKAAGVDQLRNYTGENEIDDVASEAANSADMKAAASGNPLILKETQLSNEVKKLRTLSRAHNDSEYLLRGRLNSFANFAGSYGPGELAELVTYKDLRDSATKLAVYSGKTLFTKEDVSGAIQKISANTALMGAKQTIIYKDIPFKFVREWDKYVTMVFPDNEKVMLEALSPTGIVTRMENWVSSIESKISGVEKRIAHAITEAEATKLLIGKPFSGNDDLNVAIAEHGKVQRALMKANSTAAIKPEEKELFDAAVAIQKQLLRDLGFGGVVDELEASDEEELVHAAGQANELPEGVLLSSTGFHVGKVVSRNDMFIVVNQGRDALVGHAISSLDRIPLVGDAIKIAYANGKGVVKASERDSNEALSR